MLLHCGKTLRNAGAEVAITYLNNRVESHVWARRRARGADYRAARGHGRNATGGVHHSDGGYSITG
jgi:hypothetical protein